MGTSKGGTVLTNRQTLTAGTMCLIIAIILFWVAFGLVSDVPEIVGSYIADVVIWVVTLGGRNV